eukprot:Opistho-1_new@54345
MSSPSGPRVGGTQKRLYQQSETQYPAPTDTGQSARPLPTKQAVLFPKGFVPLAMLMPAGAGAPLSLPQLPSIAAALGAEARGMRIKRPLNAFVLWSIEARGRLLQEMPHRRNADISRELGRQWKAMSAEERRPYTQRAQQLRNVFRIEHPGHKFVRPKPMFPRELRARARSTTTKKASARLDGRFRSQPPLPADNGDAGDCAIVPEACDLSPGEWSLSSDSFDDAELHAAAVATRALSEDALDPFADPTLTFAADEATPGSVTTFDYDEATPASVSHVLCVDT